MKKLMYICKTIDDVTTAKKDSTLKVKSIAQLIINVAIFIAFLILSEDLIYVLTSNGLWSIFGQKLLVSFISLVALIATVNGRIGIDTKWMQDNHIVFDFKVLKRILLDFSKMLAVLIALSIIVSLLLYTISNSTKIIDYIKETATYEPSVKTTIYNNNMFSCESINTDDVFYIMKAANADVFVSVTPGTSEDDDVKWDNVGNNQYLTRNQKEERVLTIMNNNVIRITDSNNKSRTLFCKEYLTVK